MKIRKIGKFIKIPAILAVLLSTLFLEGICAGLPDLSITNSDIIFSNDSPESGEVITITATIHNNGSYYTSDMGYIYHSSQTGSSSDYAVVCSTQWYAQYFMPSSDIYLGKVSLYLKNVGAMDDLLKVEIRKDKGYEPGPATGNENLLTSQSVVSTFTSYGWQEFNFDTAPVLSAGTTYWICMENYVSYPNAYYIWFDVGTSVDMIVASTNQGFEWYDFTSVPGNLIAFYEVYKCTNTVITCYNGDPGSGGVLIGSTTYNTPILPNGSETLSFNWTAQEGSNDIYWTADYENIIPENSDSNNFAYKNISVIPSSAAMSVSATLPDLTIENSDIVFSNSSPETGQEITISATIHNNGALYVDNTPSVKHDSSSGITSFAPVYNNSWYAQYFTVENDQYLGKVSLLMRNMGGTSDSLTVRIRNDAGYELKPSTSSDDVIVYKSVTSTFTSYGWTDFVFESNPLLAAGATYWICAENSSADELSGYRWLIDTGTPTDMLSASTNNGSSWANIAGERISYYKVYKCTDTIVSCYKGDPDDQGELIGTESIHIPVSSNGSETVFFNWTSDYGSHNIYINIDSIDIIQESLENNNAASKSIEVLLTNPTIVGDITPAGNAKGIDVTAPVSVTFSEDMDAESARQSISVKAIKNNQSVTLTSQNLVSGTTEYSNKTLTFLASWSKGYTYQVTISTVAQDLYGNNMLTPKTWVFTAIMDYTIENSFIEEDGTKVVFQPESLDEDYYVSIDTNPASEQTINTKILNANEKIKGIKGSFHSPVNNSLRKITAYKTGGQFTGNFQQGVNIVIPYTETINGMIQDDSGYLVKENSLKVYWLDEDRNLWVRIPNSQVDTSANTVTAQVSHFSLFALLGGSDTDLSGAYAYPVPWKPFDGKDDTGTIQDGITFTNLGSEATICIYTLSGELVRALEYQYASGEEQMTWDGKNSKGEFAASGAYIYYIKNSKEHKTGKLVIIR
ncbi:MAG: Ig-like domain-containing protein [Endomicrobiales bacterium]|nr:Ig-like domain-containing protein [Endomicrobiales bacterium]